MKLKMKTTAKIATMIAAASLMGQYAFAAATTGNAVQVVTAAIAITNVSNLDFGSAPQGDAQKTVSPGAAESAENGSFTVTGTPNATYTITLPSNGSVIMQTGSGGANETIAVNNFTSFPSGNGTLSAGGSQLLLVGATRAALGTSQVIGSYTAAYTVTVVY